MNYSLTDYFGGKDTDAYKTYKQGQKTGKWSDLPSYIASGNSSQGTTTLAYDPAAAQNRINQFFTDQQNTATNYMTEARAKYGINDLEKVSQGITGQMLNVEGQMEALPTQTRNETRGFDVNAAQADAILAQKQQPLTDQYSQLGRALTRSTGALESARGAYKDEIDMMSDRMARETSLFSQNMQNELDTALTKYQTGIALSQAEMQRMTQLALAESDFIKQKELMDLELRQNKDLTTFSTNEAIRQSNATKTQKTPAELKMEELQMQLLEKEIARLTGNSGALPTYFTPDSSSRASLQGIFK